MKEKFSLLIKELVANSRQSDRDLGKKINVTQPTVGRLRKKLEKENYIESYTIIPTLSKLDFELVAFITMRWKDYKEVKLLEEFKHFLKHHKNVFFSAPGEGFDNKTKIIVTFHRDYKSYELFLRELRAEWKDIIESMDSFLVSTQNIITNFDFSIICDGA
jgi:DNA-binding Lrp family transcriptional regulator